MPEADEPGLKARFETSLNRSWYSEDGWTRRLAPLSALYKTIARANTPDARDVYAPPMPTIVVGNIVVGGAGKTPLVVALCELLKAHGWRPAILSRGYHGDAEDYPHMVVDSDTAAMVGDEPLLMHRRLGVPVCIDPQRGRSARYLVAHRLCNVIICDDGLQHRKLARDIELAVVDGTRLLGNGLCLPAGPLREPASRLNEVDYVVMNGSPANSSIRYDVLMTMLANRFINLSSGERLTPKEFCERVEGHHIRAVAGIGNPRRFFESLSDLGLQFEQQSFPDHHSFSRSDLSAGADTIVLMTEKDAVKCEQFAGDNCWSMIASADLPAEFETKLLQQLSDLSSKKEQAAMMEQA